MYELCPETPADTPEVEALLDLCFAPGRTALSSYRLRDGVAPVLPLCLMLRNEYRVPVGAIRYWPVRIGTWPVLLLGPIAVHPTTQGEGLGALLMRESLERALALGWERVMLVGDQPYYGRFGFSRLEGVEMPPPTNPDRVLGLELRPGAWQGVHGLVERIAGAGAAARAGDDRAPATGDEDVAGAGNGTGNGTGIGDAAPAGHRARTGSAG